MTTFRPTECPDRPSALPSVCGHLVRTGESFETGIERVAGVLPRHIAPPERRVRDRLHHGKRILEPMTQLVDVGTSCLRPRPFFRDVTDMCRSLALVSRELCSVSIPA